jgi:hypothetical protein
MIKHSFDFPADSPAWADVMDIALGPTRAHYAALLSGGQKNIIISLLTSQAGNSLISRLSTSNKTMPT